MEKQFGLQAGFYVGLTDTETEGSFKWEKTGTYYSKMPQAMSLWSRGEPNNIGLNEHCVVVRPLDNKNKRSLNDVRCTIDHFVICQKNSYWLCVNIFFNFTLISWNEITSLSYMYILWKDVYNKGRALSLEVT